MSKIFVVQHQVQPNIQKPQETYTQYHGELLKTACSENIKQNFINIIYLNLKQIYIKVPILQR